MGQGLRIGQGGDMYGGLELQLIMVDEWTAQRYVSACEAIWRIFTFEIHFRIPAIERLSFHLPGEHTIVFKEDDTVETLLDKPSVKSSMFLAWMDCNSQYSEAASLLYSEFPRKFTWDGKGRRWNIRKSGYSIGRLYHVAPGCGELYYLRMLLNCVRGPTSFDDIRTVNGVIHTTFRDACYARGLLDDDREYVDGITEASFWGSGYYLRKLFATLLMSSSISRPDFVWDHTWKLLSEDMLQKQRLLLQIPELQLSDDQLKTYALVEIENILQSNGCSLQNYCTSLFPKEFFINDGANKLIAQETNFDREKQRQEHDTLFMKLTDEQRRIYEEIMNAISSGLGGLYFLNGHGGTGKTYMWRTLCAALRMRGDIVLPVASSGIASLLLPMGRTAHSRFGIPINVNAESMCRGIEPGTELTTLLIRTQLIIWDEAPMMHRHCFEALDRSMRDALRGSDGRPSDKPFGGKVVVLGGDLRQMLPVVPKGSRQDIVHATLTSSYLWPSCTVLKLTRNMRLKPGLSNVDELRQFADWILKVGDGELGLENEGEAEIELPDDILILASDDPLKSIVDCVYPNINCGISDLSYFQDKAILAPTNDVVCKVNEYVLSTLHGDDKVYLSSDSVCKADGSVETNNNAFTVEFLNTIRCSGLPNHELRLKVGAPVMLLRNIDQSAGLCNGTRLIVTQLGEHVIQATVLTGTRVGDKVFIPRITLSPSDTSQLPVKLRRRQFPLMLCFAMTINKSQGQSLAHVGLFLPRPVFTHGQLYVAVSRVTSRHGLKIIVSDGDNNIIRHTANVVYKEVLHNI